MAASCTKSINGSSDKLLYTGMLALPSLQFATQTQPIWSEFQLVRKKEYILVNFYVKIILDPVVRGRVGVGGGE